MFVGKLVFGIAASKKTRVGFFSRYNASAVRVHVVVVFIMRRTTPPPSPLQPRGTGFSCAAEFSLVGRCTVGGSFRRRIVVFSYFD